MKKKLINLLKNNRLYVYAFVIGVAIVSILYKLNNVTPLGGNSLLCVDFYHQYGPMLAELYDRIHNGSNLIYSFNMALGLPFFRNFLNYLSSPFNLIMFFFPRKHLITSYSFIIGLKAVAAEVAMVYYLSKKFKAKQLYLIPLGILYAFSAYFSAYYWNIMWLDGMVFLPLITLGIENIVNTGKWKLYTFSLALMLTANYFIGYMICIYAVVYFIFYLFYKSTIHKKTWKQDLLLIFKRIMTFGFSSLGAGMLGAVFLLPMFASLTSISATGGEIPTSQYYDFKVVDYLYSHFTGVSTTVFASDEITSPNISCGILSVALFLFYILNMEIPFKNKICYLGILGFMIFAFFNAPLDYIFHGFHVPNDLPYRYSFLYSFTLIVISAYALMNIKKLKYVFIALGYVLVICILLVVSKENWAGITTNMIYINMILLTLYFIFYSAFHFIDKFPKLIYVGFIIISCVDCIVAINYNWDISQVLSVFYEDYKSTEELLDYVKDYDNELFYRIENTNMMTLNDGSWYNYYGHTAFSSMAYESMAILQYNLGNPGNQINSYYYVQQTPIFDLMFGIKYFIGYSNDYLRYKELKVIDEPVNEFLYNVGLSFGVKEDIKYWDFTNPNPFKVQNDFIEKSTGIKDTLEEANILKTEEIYSDEKVTILKYTIENNGDNFYYYSRDYGIDFMLVGESLYYNNDNYTAYTPYNEELSYTYLESYSEQKIVNINSGGDVITMYVAYNSFYEDAFELYTLNYDKFIEAYETLISSKLDLKEFNEYKMTGNITLKDNMMVYTSIPYDKGWKVYVDGKETSTYALGDSLLVFDCPKGTHEIKLKYQPPYMGIGFLISIFTLFIIIINTCFKDKIIAIIKTKRLKK